MSNFHFVYTFCWYFWVVVFTKHQLSYASFSEFYCHGHSLSIESVYVKIFIIYSFYHFNDNAYLLANCRISLSFCSNPTILLFFAVLQLQTATICVQLARFYYCHSTENWNAPILQQCRSKLPHRTNGFLHLLFTLFWRHSNKVSNTYIH